MIRPIGRERLLRPLALVFVAACLVGDAAGIALAAAGELTDDGFIVAACLPAVAFGALVTLNQPRSPIGWILLGVPSMFSVQLISGSYLAAHPQEPEATAVIIAAWFAAWAWAPAIGLGGSFLPLLFPNGRLPSPRWRFVAWLAIAGIGLSSLALMFRPGPLDSDVPALNPIGIGSATGVFDVAEALGGALVVCGFFAAVTSQVLRFRQAEHEEREQLKWFAYVACLVVAGMLAAFLSTLIDSEWMRIAGDVGWVVGATSLGVGLPVAVGIAILRYRLYDIDWIINRTLVYVPLTALLAGAYIAMTGVLRTLVSDSTGGNSDAAVAFTTIVVVAMLTPVKNALQENVDRHFKEGKSPTNRLESLGREARAAAELIDRSSFVQRYLESTVAALDATGGAIQLNGHWQRRFVCSECDSAALSLTINHAGRDLGVIEVSQRRGGRPYSAQEVEALRQSLESVAYLVSLEPPQRAGRGRSA